MISHRRRCSVACLVLAVAMIAAACSSGSGARRRDQHLIVTITALPPGAAAAVRVIGAAGFHARLTRTATLSVPAGRYRIEVAGVHVATATYYAQNSLIAASSPGGVTVDYAEQVPDTTKILAAGELGLAPGTNPDGTTITFLAGAAGARVRPGDVLVIPAGPATAHTLFRKVMSVSPTLGRVDVAVTPAELRDAMPRGRLQARLPVDPTTTVRLKNSDGTCRQGLTNPTGLFNADAQVSITGSVDFDIAWGFVTPNYVKLVGQVSEHAGASISATTVLTCKVEKDSAGIDGPKFTIDLGPIPVEVTPELVAHAEAKGTIAATVGYGFSESGSAQAGFAWGTPDGSNQNLHPIVGAEAHFKAGPPPENPNETLFAGVGPQVNFNLDGIDGGPYVNFLGGINITNKQATGGRYQIKVASDARLNVGVRFNWGPLNFNISQPFDLATSTLYTAIWGGGASPTPTPTGSSNVPRPGRRCIVEAPTPVPLDIAAALPSQRLTLTSASPNQYGPLSQPPAPGHDSPGSAAECEWSGPAVTPSPPYEFPNTIITVVSIVPYMSAAVARAAWQQQAQRPVPGWPNPIGLGDAATWDPPGPEDGHASLSVLNGRFIYTVATTESAAPIAADTIAIARTLLTQLPT